MACCGDTCTISVAGSDVGDGHRFSIATNAPEIDVRTFGAGEYGEWLACAKDGTITINTYVNLDGIEAGDTGVAIIANVCGTTLTANSCTTTSVNSDVDAKSVVEWTYVFKLTGDITGW